MQSVCPKHLAFRLIVCEILYARIRRDETSESGRHLPQRERDLLGLREFVIFFLRAANNYKKL